MFNEAKVEGVILTIDGEVIGKVEVITSQVDLSQVRGGEGEVFTFAKEYIGKFESVEFSDEFKEYYEYQKKLIEIEKKKHQELTKLMELNNGKDINMRRDMNKFLKRGKKW